LSLSVAVCSKLPTSFGWPATLQAKAPDAVGFYCIIAAATVVGLALGYTPIDPIQMLIWSAVLNGIVAVPIMTIMMVVVTRLSVMGRFSARPTLTFFRVGRHGADGPYCCRTVLVLVWLSSARIASNSFRKGRPISSKGIVDGQKSTTWAQCGVIRSGLAEWILHCELLAITCPNISIAIGTHVLPDLRPV